MKAAAKKKSLGSTRRVRTRAPGLQLVIAALRPDDLNSQFARSWACKLHDIGPRLLEAQHDSGAFDDVVVDAINRCFSRHDVLLPSEQPEFARDGAFWAGVGACWYVMTQFNGGA